MPRPSTVELSMDPSWATRDGFAWGVQEGLREFIQNARDREITGDAPMRVVYVPTTKTLVITSENTNLDRASLLLGSTSKLGDERNIGGKGSGYKMAMLALTVRGHKVSIETGSEKWAAKVQKSEQFGGADCLALEVVKLKVARRDLTVRVENIEREHFTTLLHNSLFLRVTGNKHSSSMVIAESVDIREDEDRINVKYGTMPLGAVLVRPEHAGRVYVKGLYMFTISGQHANFGYDFLDLQLDEARKMADSWEMQWKTGHMHAVASSHEGVRSAVADMIVSGDHAVGYISGNTPVPKVLATEVLSKLASRVEAKATFVDSDDNAARAREVGLNPVVLTTQQWTVVKGILPPLDETIAAAAAEFIEVSAPEWVDEQFRIASRIRMVRNVLEMVSSNPISFQYGHFAGEARVAFEYAPVADAFEWVCKIDLRLVSFDHTAKLFVGIIDGAAKEFAAHPMESRSATEIRGAIYAAMLV